MIVCGRSSNHVSGNVDASCVIFQVYVHVINK